MQALHRARRSGLEFDRDDAPVNLCDVIDLAGSPPLALPVIQLGTVAGAGIGQPHLLSGQLVHQLAAQGGSQRLP